MLTHVTFVFCPTLRRVADRPLHSFSYVHNSKRTKYIINHTEDVPRSRQEDAQIQWDGFTRSALYLHKRNVGAHSHVKSQQRRRIQKRTQSYSIKHLCVRWRPFKNEKCRQYVCHCRCCRPWYTIRPGACRMEDPPHDVHALRRRPYLHMKDPPHGLQ